MPYTIIFFQNNLIILMACLFVFQNELTVPEKPFKVNKKKLKRD